MNGSRACVDLRGVRVYCTPAENVCNGFQECPDNSDETNCTGIMVSHIDRVATAKLHIPV